MSITAEVVAVNRDKNRQYMVARLDCANPSLDWLGDVVWLPLDACEDAEVGDSIDLAVTNLGKPPDKPGKLTWTANGPVMVSKGRNRRGR